MCACVVGVIQSLKRLLTKVVVAKAAVLADGLCPVVTELRACPGAKTERDEKETGEH